MTKNKHLEVIGILRSYFESHAIDKIDYPHDELLDTQASGLAHCHGMLYRMEQFIQQDRMGKTNRWLGFIQGVLWDQRRITLDELMSQNRPNQQTSPEIEEPGHDLGSEE